MVAPCLYSKIFPSDQKQSSDSNILSSQVQNILSTYRRHVLACFLIFQTVAKRIILWSWTLVASISFYLLECLFRFAPLLLCLLELRYVIHLFYSSIFFSKNYQASIFQSIVVQRQSLRTYTLEVLYSQRRLLCWHYELLWLVFLR